MSITELTARVVRAGRNRNHSKRVALLKKAHVLDANGDFDHRFFEQRPVVAKSTK